MDVFVTEWFREGNSADFTQFSRLDIHLADIKLETGNDLTLYIRN